MIVKQTCEINQIASAIDCYELAEYSGWYIEGFNDGVNVPNGKQLHINVCPDHIRLLVTYDGTLIKRGQFDFELADRDLLATFHLALIALQTEQEIAGRHNMDTLDLSKDKQKELLLMLTEILERYYLLRNLSSPSEKEDK